MVSFSSIALLSLATVGSLAAPRGLWHHEGQCMNGKDAQQVADNYAQLIRAYTTKLANQALAVNFVDYSESVNTLINTCPQGAAAKPLPLLSPSFSNRAQFEEGQGQQAPINFQQLNLEYDCKTVTIRWETTNTAPIPNPKPVVGILLIEAEKAPSGNAYPWIINTVYSEFDSGAWLQNLEEAGICSVVESGSPTIQQQPTGSSAAAASTYAAASTTAASSTWATSSATASGYATRSSQAAASSYATGSSPASSWAATSTAASYSTAA